jgi:hypothetical protein
VITNRLRVRRPAPTDRAVYLESEQCVVAGEAHVLDPAVAARLGRELVCAARLIRDAERAKKGGG